LLHVSIAKFSPYFPTMIQRPAPPDEPSARRAAQLAYARSLCERLDAAERSETRARAALLIARHEIARVRLRSLTASRYRRAT
jgi:hypothetical protein